MTQAINAFWNFIYNAAEPESVALRLDGNIIDSEREWIYEWFGIPAASPNAFRAELAKYKGKNVTLWIDSNGGSVFAAMGIYNALMEHKNTGGKITAVIEKAMSAATIPAMAADTPDRLIAPGGMWMMHNPLTDLMGGYASDFRSVADVLDEVKAAILNIYQLGTGLDRKALSNFMDAESYMSAGTAVKEGFAGGIKYTKTTNSDVTNFAFNRLAIQMAADDSSKDLLDMVKAGKIVAKQIAPVVPQQVTPQQVAPAGTVANITEGSNDMEIKNLDDLRKAYPGLVNQVEVAAVAGERKRVQEIVAVSARVDPALVSRALFEDPIDARELVFQAYQAEATAGKVYLAKADADSVASGVDMVGASPVGTVAGSAASAEKPKTAGEKFVNIVGVLNNKRMGVS